MKCVLALLISGALSACTASFHDNHYLATVKPGTSEIVNVFRVTVRGSAQMSNARYTAGFYDERAVDLFFNEVKADDLTPGKGAPRIFADVDCAGVAADACQAKRAQRLAMVPVGDSAQQSHGAFVMILSTDADAISSTIGAFSESDVAMQSTLFLATKDTHREAAKIAAASTTVSGLRTGTMKTIEGLLQIDPTSSAEADQRNLAILRAVAGGLSPQAPPNFTTKDEASAWFAIQNRGAPK